VSRERCLLLLRNTGWGQPVVFVQGAVERREAFGRGLLRGRPFWLAGRERCLLLLSQHRLGTTGGNYIDIGAVELAFGETHS
jgi:hypothetical protein